jgi:hypothetical protein
MTKVFAAMRSAKPEDLPRLVDSLSKLEQMLPAPPEHSPLDQLDAHCAGVPS